MKQKIGRKKGRHMVIGFFSVTPPRLQPEDFFEITLKVIDSSRFLCFGTPSR